MIIPEQTVKMLCAFCKKENEVNGNQDLSITNCFHCGENVIGLKKEKEKVRPKKMDKDEQIILLINQLEKTNAILFVYKEMLILKKSKTRIEKTILENVELIEKIKRE